MRVYNEKLKNEMCQAKKPPQKNPAFKEPHIDMSHKCKSQIIKIKYWSKKWL